MKGWQLWPWVEGQEGWGRGQGRRGALAAAVATISIPLQEKGLTGLFANSPGVNLPSHRCAVLGQGVIMPS